MLDLRFLTNIANPYNGALYDELNAIGCNTEVLYKSKPIGEGRTWTLSPQPYERITSPLRDVQLLTGEPARNTVLSGGYHRSRDVLRTAVTTCTRTRLSFWGERLQGARPSARVRMARRVLLRPMSCIFAIGSWARDSYREVVPTGRPIHVFPYGLPAATVSPDRSDEPLLGYAGSLIKRKGVADFLTATAALPRRPPRLEVVGSGPERHRLHQLADHLRLEVTWYDEVDKPKLDALRSRWWAQVVPSRYDGWGMVVPEALAAGVPVLATDQVGAARDVVISGLTGELIAGPAELPGAMARLLDPGRQADLSGGARILGRELVADRAARWLADLLEDQTAGEQSFIADAMSAARRAGLPVVTS